MSSKKTHIAIRLLGFLQAEEEVFAKVFLEPRNNDVQFMCLQEGCLQDPDIYLVNAEDIKAIATLSDLHPGEAQPVLMVGKTKLELSYPSFPRPVRWRELFILLDEMVGKRQALLKNLRAFSHVAVPERRRRDRLDFDLTDPDVYKKMRAPESSRGGILIVDKDRRFTDFVTAVMEKHKLPVTLTSDAETALRLDEHNHYSLTFINTSTPDIDPYGLCRLLKSQDQYRHNSVILLVDRNFTYNHEFALNVACEGFLNKPLSRKLVISTIQKFVRLG